MPQRRWTQVRYPPGVSLCSATAQVSGIGKSRTASWKEKLLITLISTNIHLVLFFEKQSVCATEDTKVETHDLPSKSPVSQDGSCVTDAKRRHWVKENLGKCPTQCSTRSLYWVFVTHVLILNFMSLFHTIKIPHLKACCKNVSKQKVAEGSIAWMIFKYAILISLSIFKKEYYVFFFLKIVLIKLWIDLLEKAVFELLGTSKGRYCQFGDIAVCTRPVDCQRSPSLPMGAREAGPSVELTLQWESPEPTGSGRDMKVIICISISDFYTQIFFFGEVSFPIYLFIFYGEFQSYIFCVSRACIYGELINSFFKALLRYNWPITV